MLLDLKRLIGIIFGIISKAHITGTIMYYRLPIIITQLQKSIILIILKYTH